MRVRGNPAGSAFAKSLYFSIEEIDRMCEEALRKSGLLPRDPAPVNIDLFIEKYFQCEIDFGSEIEEGVLGYTFFADTGKILRVGVTPAVSDGTQSGARRVRSTLAHEAGHCLMHPVLFMKESHQLTFGGQNIDHRQNSILCRMEDFKTRSHSYDGRWWEYQANRAISGLLLPKRLVHAAVAPFMSPQGSMGIDWLADESVERAARGLADIFDVNPVVARIRLQEMFPRDGKPVL